MSKQTASTAGPYPTNITPSVNVGRYANFVYRLRRKHLVFDQFSFSPFFIGHNKGSTFTGTDRNGPNY